MHIVNPVLSGRLVQLTVFLAIEVGVAGHPSRGPSTRSYLTYKARSYLIVLQPLALELEIFLSLFAYLPCIPSRSTNSRCSLRCHVTDRVGRVDYE